MIYAQNTRAAKYVKQKLKGKIEKFTIIIGDFNTTLSTINKSRKKISKDIEELNNTINQQD